VDSPSPSRNALSRWHSRARSHIWDRRTYQGRSCDRAGRAQGVTAFVGQHNRMNRAALQGNSTVTLSRSDVPGRGDCEIAEAISRFFRWPRRPCAAPQARRDRPDIAPAGGVTAAPGSGSALRTGLPRSRTGNPESQSEAAPTASDWARLPHPRLGDINPKFDLAQ
jgi:hypothetical protein